MPLIRVTSSESSFFAEQKAELAPLLVDTVMVEEVDPVTVAARNATFIVYNDVPHRNWVGTNGQTFWLVESFVDAGFFNQARRDDAQARIAKAFVTVLSDDGSWVEQAGKTVSPAYLRRIYSLLIEIPEGSWGWLGRTTSALDIGLFIGTDKDEDPTRWSELKEVTAKMTADRIS